ncbi:hypothetical protein OROGR_022992 [Orobanche gracilis]
MIHLLHLFQQYCTRTLTNQVPIPLSEIDVKTRNKTVIVRILRVWIKKDTEKNEGLELILVDEWYNRIQATISVGSREKFMSSLMEGAVVAIKNFQRIPNNPKYQNAKVNHESMISFGFATKVQPQEGSYMKDNSFDFIRFGDIPTQNISFMFDILGEVKTEQIEIEHVEMKNDTNATKCDVLLEDADGTQVTCVLWGTLAEQLKSFIENKSSDDNEPVIMALQFVMILNGAVVSSAANLLILEETSYNIEEMKAVGESGFFFLYGYSGTGKTFVWKTLCSAIRGRGQIVLPVASSGIASLLLPKGRTTHSRLSIPLDIDESATCSKITPGSDLNELLKVTKLIIWDEAPMTHRYCFEALDRSLRDVMRSSDGSKSKKPFGGLVVVLGGDFRQILPVVPKGTRHDIVHASISSSRLWSSCEVLRLTKNMRLQCGSSRSEVEETKEFAEWILKVGDGMITDGEANVRLSDDILIRDSGDTVASIVCDIYPEIMHASCSPEIFKDRAILAPTNDMVDEITI